MFQLYLKIEKMDLKPLSGSNPKMCVCQSESSLPTIAEEHLSKATNPELHE